MQEQFITITRMRKELFAVTDAIFKKNHTYTVTEHGEPKVILLSPKRYSALQKLHEKGRTKTLRNSFAVLSHQFSSVVRDIPNKRYAIPSPSTSSSTQEGANSFANAKKLAVAQLYVKLVDEYAYPPDRILLDTCVRTGGTHSNKTIDIDVLIMDKNGKPWALCCALPSDYAEATASAVQDLFELAQSLREEYAHDTVKHLLIFSRGASADKRPEKWSTIDTKKFPSLKKWQESGSPIGAVFPKGKK